MVVIGVILGAIAIGVASLVVIGIVRVAYDMYWQ
jgi:hypothetical protein